MGGKIPRGLGTALVGAPWLACLSTLPAVAAQGQEAALTDAQVDNVVETGWGISASSRIRRSPIIMAKTTRRIPGRDFTPPTPEDCDALVAYLLSDLVAPSDD